MPPLRPSPFDTVASIYNDVRPTYPPALFDDLWEDLALPAVADVVEVGPGTGQATAALLQRGACVTAVELGPNLARFLAARFSGAPALTVVNAAFEDAMLPPAAFDLVAAATSFHWIDPAVRFTRARSLLRPGGAIAIIETNQVESGADRGYFQRSQSIYRRYFPDEVVSPPPKRGTVPPLLGELDRGGLFAPATLRHYPWDQTYQTPAYADLMRSYSNMQDMDAAPREALIAELCTLIDAEFGGRVTRPLEIALIVARVRAT